MPGEFAVLYHELTKLTPMTQATDTDFKKQRVDVLQRLGMMGHGKAKGGTGPVIRQENRNLGKKARQRSNEARQEALHMDNKAASLRKMEVHSIVQEVEEKMKLSKDLSKYVKAKKEIPPRLLRQLVGKQPRKTARLAPLTSGKQEAPMHKITVARVPTQTHAYSSNRWSEPERLFLLDLYRELEKPKIPNVELWKIYYSRLADRFRALHPGRKQQEIIQKLEDMISKKQIKDEREVKYWSKVRTNKEMAITNARIIHSGSSPLKNSYAGDDGNSVNFTPSKTPSNIATKIMSKKSDSLSQLGSVSLLSSSVVAK